MAEELPDRARAYEVQLASRHLVYVDATTGEILVDMDPSRRSYAWLYYALHTYQFPGLAGRDALRIPLMLLLLTGGFALTAELSAGMYFGDSGTSKLNLFKAPLAWRISPTQQQKKGKKKKKLSVFFSLAKARTARTGNDARCDCDFLSI